MSTIRHRAWSATGLLEAIADNALLPQNQQTFTPDVLLAMLNVEMESRVVPHILGLDANFFLKTAFIDTIQSNSTALGPGITQTLGSNVPYQLPADAVGKKLQNVSAISQNGAPVNLPLLTTWQVSSPTVYAQGAFVEGDVLYLFPAQSFTSIQHVQIVYPAAPLSVCNDTGIASTGKPSSAEVTAVDYVTGAVTLAALPTSFAVDAEVNFVGGDPQFQTKAESVITAIVGLQITVDPAVLTDPFSRPTVVPGDWAADLGYSPFCQMPAEARNLVVQATVVKLLRALKDDGAKVAKADYDEMLISAYKLFTPRINDSPKVISSFGRGIGAWGRRGWLWRS